MRLVPTDVGRPIGDIKSYSEIPDVDEVVGRVLRTLVPDQRDVQDSEGRWYELTIRPYLTSERTIDGAVLVYQDIDVRRRAASELGVARAAADAANQAKASFLTTMSHELRTPLNAITGYTALLADGLRGPVTLDQSTDLDRIRLAGGHLLALINDILNFAKLEAAHVRFESEAVPVHETLGAAAAMVEPQARSKGIAFECPGCQSASAVRGDREKVLQIVLNLLSNAVRFTPAGGGIVVSCGATDAVVTISVRDTGRGIALDDLERIFEPFVQVGQRLAGREAGAGLGLSISRELARAMGGDLIAASVVGAGSTFSLVLPRAAPIDDATPRGEHAADDSGAADRL
jgi:signal transduction histidine kinase